MFFKKCFTLVSLNLFGKGLKLKRGSLVRFFNYIWTIIFAFLLIGTMPYLLEYPFAENYHVFLWINIQ